MYLKECRYCKSTNLKKVIDLGDQPLANNLLKTMNEKFKKFPLKINFCKKCFNSQLSYVVNKKFLFTNYFYKSSTSEDLINHFDSAAKKYISKFNLNKKSNIIDIGSNDGIALRYYKKSGFNNLCGIEPSKNLSDIANKSGIKTLNEFFSKKTVKKLNKYRIVTLSNVFAHIHKTDTLIKNIKKILDLKGVIIIEFQYLVNTIKDVSFDNIYHEHLNYCTLTPLIKYFKKFQLEVFDVEKINTHGGSLRIYVSRRNVYTKNISVNKVLRYEKKEKINNISYFKKFNAKLDVKKKLANSNIKKLIKNKVNFVGYGAPAKATTLLNYFDLKREFKYIIEDNTFKINKYIPGTISKIIKKNNKIKYDIIVVLAWNYFNKIKKKNYSLAKKFIKIY